MKRRVLSLLIALCLIVGLLPAITVHHVHAAGAALETEYVLKFMNSGSTNSMRAFTLTNYDTPIYTKNTTYTNGVFDATGTTTYSYITQSTTDASEDDWNAKLIWHTGDEGPTLYLDGFVMDNYNEEANAWRRRTTSAQHLQCAIYCSNTAPLTIVLQGEDSYIQNYTGIHYTNALTIESVGDTKLVMKTGKSGIVPRNTETGMYDSNGSNASGYTLTLNANIDISVSSGQSWSNAIITTDSANMIINGGNINVTSYKDGPWALMVKNSGNVVVNGGNTNAIAGYRGIKVWPNYTVHVNGGTFAIDGQWGAIYASSAGSPSTDYCVAPILPADGCYTLWQGGDADTATEVDALTGKTAYFKVAFTQPNKVAANAADCKNPGNIQYWSCPDCGKYYSDADGKNEITDKNSVVIPATGHTEETVPGYGATCAKPGLTDGTKCKICGETLLTQEELPIEDHKLDEHIAVEPEAGKAGNTAYWECTVCGKFFSDAEGTQEVEKDSWYLAPLCDHEGTQQTTTEEVTTPATCGDAGKKTVTVTCECGQVVSVTEGVEIPATGDHTTEPIPGYGATCTKSGLTDGEKCTVCKQILLKQEEIPASGHNYDEKGECANGCGDRRPVITTDGGCFRVTMNGYVYVRGYIFYLESAEGVDLTKWSEVKAAAEKIPCSPYGVNDWMTYTKLTNLNKSALPEDVGVYVLFVTYTDAAGTTRQVAESIEVKPAIKPEITCGSDKFAVDMNGLDYSKGYIFYLESAEGVDLTNWSAVMKAAKSVAGSPFNTTNDWMTYSKLENLNKSALPEEAGVYVLFVTYVDANGATKQVSAAIEVQALTKPEIVCGENRFTVEMTGLDYSKGYIFYLESAEGVDLTNWSAVMKAAKSVAGSPFNTTNDWMTYTKLENLNKSTLPSKAGVYVLFVTYADANGATKQISAAIEIEAASEPEITCGENQFAVDMQGLAYSKGYIFYLESADGVDTTNWNSVMKAAKRIAGSPYGVTSDWKTYSTLEKLNKSTLPETSGVYVLFVTYVDANGATQQISAVITK